MHCSIKRYHFHCRINTHIYIYKWIKFGMRKKITICKIRFTYFCKHLEMNKILNVWLINNTFFLANKIPYSCRLRFMDCMKGCRGLKLILLLLKNSEVCVLHHSLVIFWFVCWSCKGIKDKWIDWLISFVACQPLVGYLML